MSSFIRRAGANVLRTIARTLDPIAEADRVQLFSKTVGDAPQLFVRSPDYPRQVSGIECSIWDRPLVPHALDDEFESTVLDPSWTISGVTQQGGIDPFNNPPNSAYELHTDRRPSWLMIQPTSGGILFSKDISSISGGDFFVYARFSMGTRSTAPANNEATIQLDLGGPVYDLANRLSFYYNESDASIYQAEYLTVVGGVNTSVARSRNIYSGGTGMATIEALGLQKRGNVFDAWAFTGAGTALWLGSTAYNLATDTVHLRFGNVTNVNPAYMIHGVDFCRFKEGALFLP